MLAIISPSKNLDENPVHISSSYSIPEFLDDSKLIIEKLQKYSPDKLSRLMGINPKLTMLNIERFARWNPDFSEENAKRAILMFSGEVFNGLMAKTMNENDLLFANDSLRILSGLYGILRPMDLIQAYRLEMGTRLKVNRKPDLYSFWGERLTESLNRAMEGHKEKVLVNLASDEYFKAINTGKLNARIVKCQFKEERNGKLQFVTIFGKKARGLMVRFMIENRLDSVEDLKAFDVEGYYFNNEHSNDEVWMFTR